MPIRLNSNTIDGHAYLWIPQLAGIVHIDILTTVFHFFACIAKWPYIIKKERRALTDSYIHRKFIAKLKNMR